MSHLDPKELAKIAVTVVVIGLFILAMVSLDVHPWMMHGSQFTVPNMTASLNRNNKSKRSGPVQLQGKTTSPSSVSQMYNSTISSLSEGELQDQESINAERVKEMNDYCKILDKNESFYKNLDMLKVPPSRLGHLYVNDKYKFIHCMIPKIGCTNWKRLFLGLAGVKSPFVRQLSVHRSPRVARMRLSNYTPDEIAYRLQHYTKSIAVRDPMERVLSAFRSKLSSPGKRSFHEKYGAEILQKYHPDLPQYVLDKGMGVTFQDFVHHLTHPMDFPDLKPWVNMNQHWERYIKSCHPCYVRYDIVAKYETLAEDVRFILKKINASDVISWPERSLLYHQRPTSELVSEAIKNISSQDMMAFRALYYNDYKMFGYKFHSHG